jgi:hypothetical protein
MIRKTVFALLWSAAVFAQNSRSVQLAPITVPRLAQSWQEARTIYSIDYRFSSRDTVLFSTKKSGLSIMRVDSIGPSELSCDFSFAPGFSDFGVHDLFVLSPNGEKKATIQMEVRLGQMPDVDYVTLYQSRRMQRDTLRLSTSGRTLAAMVIHGKALLADIKVEFDESSIRVTESSWRYGLGTDSLRVSLEVDGKNVALGGHTFRIKSPFGPEGFGRLWLQGEYPPRLSSAIPTLFADGKERKIRVNGDNLYKGLQASLLPAEGVAAVEVLSVNTVDATITLPVLDHPTSYRLVVANADGQADTSNYFIGQAMPLSSARVRNIEDGVLFLNRKTRVVLGVDVAGNRRLARSKSYELKIDDDRFPVTQVLDDSTCEVDLLLTLKQNKSFLDRQTFTLAEAANPPSWKGVLESKRPPAIQSISGQRILHPLDTLALVIKGSQLEKAVLNVDDPDVHFKVLEDRNDLLRVQVSSTRSVKSGVYPLEVRLYDIPFRFEAFPLSIQPWQSLHEYCRLEMASSAGPANALKWSNTLRAMNSDDAIRVRILPTQLAEGGGMQKIEINGVLLDSSNTVRSESLDKKYFAVERDQEAVVWQWRPKVRGRSGERIEISLRNPGDQNRLQQTFIIKRRWYEAFQPSTSFVLFKIPMGGGQATTEILRSIGIGMSYQPTWMQKFMSADVSFILGNITSDTNNFSMQTALGVSVIFWNYLQVGLGTNLAGESKSPMFVFVGSRFRLPSPWRF